MINISFMISDFKNTEPMLYNIWTTLAQRLLRWSNIVQMLYKCFVFTGIFQIVDNTASQFPVLLRIINSADLWLVELAAVEITFPGDYSQHYAHSDKCWLSQELGLRNGHCS